jgi:hypothetical protein
MMMFINLFGYPDNSNEAREIRRMAAQRSNNSLFLMKDLSSEEEVARAGNKNTKRTPQELQEEKQK